MAKIITGNETPEELVQYDKKILQTKNQIEFVGESFINNQSNNSINLQNFVINVDGFVNKSTIIIKSNNNTQLSFDNACIFIRDSQILILQKDDVVPELSTVQHIIFVNGNIKLTNNNTTDVIIDILSYKVKMQ